MIAVQSRLPVAKAFDQGASASEMWPTRHLRLPACASPKPYGDSIMLEILARLARHSPRHPRRRNPRLTSMIGRKRGPILSPGRRSHRRLRPPAGLRFSQAQRPRSLLNRRWPEIPDVIAEPCTSNARSSKVMPRPPAESRCQKSTQSSKRRGRVGVDSQLRPSHLSEQPLILYLPSSLKN